MRLQTGGGPENALSHAMLRKAYQLMAPSTAISLMATA
jgi:hypothetical protein